MISVLFVCLGNICRSPMAEGIFYHHVQSLKKSSQFKIDSAGTASYHIGKLADPRTIQVCKANNIALTHKARAFHSSDFNDFDFIFAMDQNNLEDMKSMMPIDSKAELMLMRAFDDIEQGADVPDPYYGELSDFDLVYQMLQRNVPLIYDYIIRTHEKAL